MVDKAPFKKRGGLWHYPPPKEAVENPNVPIGKRPTLEWREVRPWHDTMLVTGIQRGRSAAFFLMIGGERGQDSFPMFLSDFADMVKTATVERGTVTGWWVVVKKGQNYGIKYLGEGPLSNEMLKKGGVGR